MTTIENYFNFEKISSSVYCITEKVTKLLIYLIIGDDKAALIDTGSGNGNLLDFIQSNSLLTAKQKLIVINTHNHAEQVRLQTGLNGILIPLKSTFYSDSVDFHTFF